MLPIAVTHVLQMRFLRLEQRGEDAIRIESHARACVENDRYIVFDRLELEWCEKKTLLGWSWS
jgi:hypothetical protein